ncbi:nucleotidyl transferase AbiEii/AbiGii toxin family protein [Trueperella pecoris]|uniref:nucleotidyl transferase AbiEii/AbiGii toxin family protein n=1 Tax=Trueperella pecoris TaxID=2733571 RepID=UPI001ABE7DC4|nr:nucleotidyl transferase AbiEii/AbiGii toxin family protein [Trueperella pecoris]QTG74968.1 nucleotidyl transferase AbiEii/AbiGii toxin family protein [Trueperella pecoris]
MIYKSPAALEMALKAAAVSSPFDANRAVSSFYFHRLLYRVFSGGNNEFVLKGGHAVLARTTDARATRDIDLVTQASDLFDAVTRLRELVQRDAGDFIAFEYLGSRPIKAEQEYRRGFSVRFLPVMGAKRMKPISIDLVIDEVPIDGVEVIAPADRIEIQGIPSCDYFVYPVENGLADKVCALIEEHDGRPSSRVKDLVDLAVYATTAHVNGAKLSKCLRRETAVRGIEYPEVFELPAVWGTSQARQFAKLWEGTGLPSWLKPIEAAYHLASSLLDPVLSAEADGLCWNPAALRWE